MSSQSDLVKRIKSYLPNADEKVIVKAFYFSKKAHMEQKRASGEPYFMHPLAVANILIDLKLDVPTIVTGLLHDTVEDTFVTLDLVRREFGEEIAGLVDGVTKLNKIDTKSDNLRQAEDFRKFFVALSKDIRVLLVKIADRLHNLRTLNYVSSKIKRIKKAQETLELYAPLTERVGVQTIKNEMQDLAFKELYPDARESIIHRLEFLQQKGGLDIVAKINEEIQAVLSKNNLNCEVRGRQKEPYSIWMKMQKKNISFEQLSDIMAFRVITKNTMDCYQALGIIHQHFHMVPASFKDYISTPKNNGYKSIHTTVIGPFKERIEVQIRSEKMHDVAEYGIAAHWCYKQTNAIRDDIQSYRWIKDMVHSLKDGANSEEFLKNTRLEMYEDQVFCFSPIGDLVVLPAGATPIDFAYSIHSEIGNTCMGVKINGVVAPLRSVLNNGDQVEVICSKEQKPSESWDEFVVTSKAKMQIRRFIRQQKRSNILAQTSKDIEKYFRSRKSSFNDEIIAELLAIFAKENKEELFLAVADGGIKKSALFKAAYPNHKKIIKRPGFLDFLKSKKKDFYKTHNHPIRAIEGISDDYSLAYAECCYPIMGDKIMGVKNRGLKRVTVHRNMCKKLKSLHKKEKLKPIFWTKEEDIQDLFSARLFIIAENQFGTVAEITNIVSSCNMNISNLKIIARNENYMELNLEVIVRNLKELYNLKAILRSAKIIFSIERPV